MQQRGKCWAVHNCKQLHHRRWCSRHSHSDRTDLLSPVQCLLWRCNVQCWAGMKLLFCELHSCVHIVQCAQCVQCTHKHNGYIVQWWSWCGGIWLAVKASMPWTLLIGSQYGMCTCSQKSVLPKICIPHVYSVTVCSDGTDMVGYGWQPYESKAALRCGSINATHLYLCIWPGWRILCGRQVLLLDIYMRGIPDISR